MINFLRKINIYIFICLFFSVFSIENALFAKVADGKSYTEEEDYDDEDEDYETFDGLSKNNFAVMAGIGVNSSLKNVIKGLGMDINAGIRWSYQVSDQASVLSTHGVRFILNTSSAMNDEDVLSKSFFMIFYETRIGVSVARFSPYVKALLGGMLTKNTLIVNNQPSLLEKDKKSELSLAGGFGFGLSFHAAKYLSVFIEYNFILSNARIALADSSSESVASTNIPNIYNNAQVFSHKMHLISMGVNFEFNIDS